MTTQTKTRTRSKTPQELMRKHILDKNDVISEEDFKNMAIGLDIESGKGSALELSDSKQRPKDENKDPGIETPWDLIQ